MPLEMARHFNENDLNSNFELLHASEIRQISVVQKFKLLKSFNEINLETTATAKEALLRTPGITATIMFSFKLFASPEVKKISFPVMISLVKVNKFYL